MAHLCPRVLLRIGGITPPAQFLAYFHWVFDPP
jgi:hypothetical protein